MDLSSYRSCPAERRENYSYLLAACAVRGDTLCCQLHNVCSSFVLWKAGGNLGGNLEVVWWTQWETLKAASCTCEGVNYSPWSSDEAPVFLPPLFVYMWGLINLCQHTFCTFTVIVMTWMTIKMEINNWWKCRSGVFFMCSHRRVPASWTVIINQFLELLMIPERNPRISGIRRTQGPSFRRQTDFKIVTN